MAATHPKATSTHIALRSNRTILTAHRAMAVSGYKGGFHNYGSSHRLQMPHGKFGHGAYCPSAETCVQMHHHRFQLQPGKPYYPKPAPKPVPPKHVDPTAHRLSQNHNLNPTHNPTHNPNLSRSHNLSRSSKPQLQPQPKPQPKTAA